MLLLGYLLGLAVLVLYGRERSRGLMIVGYSYLFMALLLFFQQLPAGSAYETVRALILSLYSAACAITFQWSPQTAGLQTACIALIGSICTVQTVALLLFRRALDTFSQKRRVRRAETVYVVCGAREDAQALIRDIGTQVQKPAIVYLPTETDEVPIPGALTAGDAFWETLRPEQCCHAVLLPDARLGNYERLRQLDALGSRLPDLHVTAFLDNDLLRLEDLHFDQVDSYLVSREQLLVRAFLSENLPIHYLQAHGHGAVRSGIYIPDGPFSLCMIGFGVLGREFLLETFENTAFETAAPDRHGLDVLIAADKLDLRRDSFRRDFPHMAEEPGLTWLAAAPEADLLFHALEARGTRLHQVLIDTEDTDRNIHTALRVLRLFRRMGLDAQRPQLIVALYDDAEGSVALLSGEKDVFFQRVNRTQFTCAELIDRAADRQAAALHRRYRAGNLHTETWRRLGTFTQDSNRAVVWDIPNKLALAGDLSALDAAQRETVCWQLAQYEHRRWNMFHFTRGWTPLPPEALTADERARCATKRPAEKRHACLTDWDALDALPQASPGLLKQYDYENVVQLLSAPDKGGAQ